MVHVGIDIGTSNTLVAFIAPTGEPAIHNVAGHWLVPSVIHVDAMAGYRSVGQEALTIWADPSDEGGIFRRWKLQMGEGALLRRMPIGAVGSNTVEEITPERLTTWLVEHVLENITQGVGGSEIESVLVTVPHGWRRENPERCRATKESARAARVAGAEVKVQPVTLSEPVAAAVYWLWEARRSRDPDEFVGKDVMVVDIGGGTFDLSLVRIGTPEEPLNVISAVNNNYAGDFATALMLARVCREFNRAHGTSLPTTAEAVLDALPGEDYPFLRQWFIDVESKFTHDLSAKVSVAASRNRPAPRPVVADFRADGLRVEITVTAEQWLTELEPFYASGRELVTEFLASVNESPYAVVFAGGGSRIAGVSERIVAPALGTDTEALNRIPFNPNRVDQAVALGAALVAAGVVTVREKLLSDVGLIVTLPETFRKVLNIAGEVLVTPMLRRGSDLPAKFQSDLFNGFTIQAGDSTVFEVVIDDDPNDPWVQQWSVNHPAGGSRAAIQLGLEADTDGRLTVTLDPGNAGVATNSEGQLNRRRSGRGRLTIEDPEAASTRMPRVTPEKLHDALRELRRSSTRQPDGTVE